MALSPVAAAAYRLHEAAGSVSLDPNQLINLVGDGAVSLDGAGHAGLLLAVLLLLGTLLLLNTCTQGQGKIRKDDLITRFFLCP